MSEGGSIRADKAPQSSRSGVLVPPTLRESQASIRQGEAMPHGRHVSVCMCSAWALYPALLTLSCCRQPSPPFPFPLPAALEMEVQPANHAQGIRWSLKI